MTRGLQHHTVILFGIAYDPGVLLCAKKLVAHEAWLAAIRLGQLIHLFELLCSLMLTTRMQAEIRLVAIGLAVGAKVVKAAVTMVCTAGGLRVGLVQVVESGLHRAKKAIQIKPVKANLPLRLLAVVRGTQPLDKFKHHRVAPHPGRKPLEARQRSPRT